MIGFGSQYLTAAGFGRYKITAASLGNLDLLGWLKPATKQAILGAFGDDGVAVINATNAYLNGIAASDRDKATALVGFINEDPMMVCSLGLEPQGVTMPIRGLAGDGQAYIATGLYYANGGHTEININGSFAQAGDYALFGNLQTNNGNWYGINTSGQFFFRCINVNTTGAACTMDKFYKYQGVFDSTCTLKVTDITGTTAANLSLTRPSNDMGSNSIFLFSQNFGGSATRTSKFRMSFAEIIQGDVHREMYCFVRKINGVEKYGMLDVLSDTFYQNAGSGAFSIDYRLPDGTPWTPSTP